MLYKYSCNTSFVIHLFLIWHTLYQPFLWPLREKRCLTCLTSFLYETVGVPWVTSNCFELFYSISQIQAITCCLSIALPFIVVTFLPSPALSCVFVILICHNTSTHTHRYFRMYIYMVNFLGIVIRNYIPCCYQLESHMDFMDFIFVLTHQRKTRPYKARSYVESVRKNRRGFSF